MKFSWNSKEFEAAKPQIGIGLLKVAWLSLYRIPKAGKKFEPINHITSNKKEGIA